MVISELNMLAATLLFTLSGIADTSSWAFAAFNEGANCTGAVKGGDEEDFPMLLDECILKYRGSPDQANWIYVKSTCNATVVEQVGYTDSACTVRAADDSFNEDMARGCDSDGRTIQCETDHTKAVAKAYMVGTRGASACSEGTYVSDQQFVIGVCHIRPIDSGYRSYKAKCDSGKVVMEHFVDLVCTGEAETLFEIPEDTCAAGFNTNAFMLMKEGCSCCSTTSEASPLIGVSALGALLIGMAAMPVF